MVILCAWVKDIHSFLGNIWRKHSYRFNFSHFHVLHPLFPFQGIYYFCFLTWVVSNFQNFCFCGISVIDQKLLQCMCQCISIYMDVSYCMCIHEWIVCESAVTRHSHVLQVDSVILPAIFIFSWLIVILNKKFHILQPK